MTIVHVGELSIGGAVPGASAAVDAGVAGINGALPDITARLGALAAFSPLPVDFAEQLTLAQSIVVSVQSGIALGLPVPSIADQIAQVSALVAELLATVTAVNAQLSIVLAVKSLLTAAGVSAYAYTGLVNGLGGDVAAELAGGLPGGSPTDPCNAVVLVTATPETWDAMSSFFKVTP
jgi:hypothetical protein